MIGKALSRPGAHLLAPVVMWVLGAHMERSQASGQDQVLIRYLFPTSEAKQGEPQVRAEHRFWAQPSNRGVWGGPVPQVSDAQ